MNSLFKQLINKISNEHGLIIEQGPPPTPPQDEQPVDQPLVNDQTGEPIEPNTQQTQQPVQTDENQVEQPEESNLPDKDDNGVLDSKELLYIKLIYKALVTELDPSQYVDMVNIKDINANNAKEVLNKLESIINSNTSID